MSNLLYAHDPEVAYTAFKIFGISFFLVFLVSFILSIILFLIINKLNKANDEKNIAVSFFKSSFIFGVLIGIIGLAVDFKLAINTDFYRNNILIFIWFIGVFLGEIIGFILEYSKNNKN